MTLREILYPPCCPFCGRMTDEDGPCAYCMTHSKELTAVICRRCGAYPEDCGCMGRTFSFVRNVACYTYEEAARTLLLRFKFRNKPQLSHLIARRMYYHIRARLGTEFSVVTYVPQSRYAWHERGYYPTRLLAKRLGRLLGIPVVHSLARRGGPEQKTLNGAARWENARKCFRLRRKAALSGRVLLIDDIFTTGATLNACTELLKRAGAEEVFCATFAIDVKNS